MSALWINFVVIIFVQLVLFVIHAYFAKKILHIPRILLHGAIVGVVMGVFFDLVLGKLFGFHSYMLGFGTLFLSLNWILSYGLFAANTLLLQPVRMSYFFLWVIVVVAAYETINRFFHVWTWELTFPHFAFLLILLLGYFVGAVFVVILSHVFFGYRFHIVRNLLKK